jgi:L-serine dehydratase
MPVSVLDLFKIGIGPSSSHTVGPMRAARQFALLLRQLGLLGSTELLRAELFGSLGATGKGHGSDLAVLLGLQGDTPELVDTAAIAQRVAALRAARSLHLLGEKQIDFVEADHLLLHKRHCLPYHPNGMVFTAYRADGETLLCKTYYSIGGGFIVTEKAAAGAAPADCGPPLPHPFHSAAQLLAKCAVHDMPVSALMLENESAWRPKEETRAALLAVWQVMQDCVRRGCQQDGILPGGLQVRRRAAALYRKLSSQPESGLRDPLTTLDWVNLYALAVNEENAAGGRVVTAPTNGAAGIIPAVLHYYTRCVPGADDDGVVRFLLCAGAIAILYKENASVSGAEVGCQGEVGVACSMAAGALAEVMGGTPQQVENAAEIGMEHNLGLTCDPIGGLVQVPCIERNAMGAVKAINAARIALRGDGQHHVSLDKVIRTMRATGADMKTKYKETSRGSLAINLPEC